MQETHCSSCGFLFIFVNELELRLVWLLLPLNMFQKSLKRLAKEVLKINKNWPKFACNRTWVAECRVKGAVGHGPLTSLHWDMGLRVPCPTSTGTVPFGACLLGSWPSFPSTFSTDALGNCGRYYGPLLPSQIDQLVDQNSLYLS